jgi:hypothetical protein
MRSRFGKHTPNRLPCRVPHFTLSRVEGPAPFRVRAVCARLRRAAFLPSPLRFVIPTGVADFILPFAPRERRQRSGGTVATHDPHHTRRVADRLSVGTMLGAASLVFKGAGFDFSYVPSFGGWLCPPGVLLFAGIQMHLSIRDDRNISSTLQELHYFLAAPRHCCPTGFRLGILFQSPQIFSIVLKIDLLEFSLRRQSNRKALFFERNRLPVFHERLLIDS